LATLRVVNLDSKFVGKIWRNDIGTHHGIYSELFLGCQQLGEGVAFEDL